MNAKNKANELRIMHYKLIFDIDNGANVRKDEQKYLASIYAAKLTVNSIQNAIKHESMLCKQRVMNFYQNVYDELVLQENKALAEMG